MRTDHRIEYVVVRGSCRYRLSEILRLLEDNTVRNEEGDVYKRQFQSGMPDLSPNPKCHLPIAPVIYPEFLKTSASV